MVVVRVVVVAALVIVVVAALVLVVVTGGSNLYCLSCYYFHRRNLWVIYTFVLPVNFKPHGGNFFHICNLPFRDVKMLDVTK
jgi:hypothetical protein